MSLVEANTDRLPQFGLSTPGPLTDLMRERAIATFRAAAAYVRDLPYRRPNAAGDMTAVLKEGCGTCRSKHAVLAKIAREQGVAGVELILGLYEMRDQNTPGVAAVLSAYGLSWLPEAHCYLRYAGRRIDLTGLPAGIESPFDALLNEELCLRLQRRVGVRGQRLRMGVSSSCAPPNGAALPPVPRPTPFVLATLRHPT